MGQVVEGGGVWLKGSDCMEESCWGNLYRQFIEDRVCRRGHVEEQVVKRTRCGCRLFRDRL